MYSSIINTSGIYCYRKIYVKITGPDSRGPLKSHSRSQGKGVGRRDGRGRKRGKVVWQEERNDQNLKGMPTLIARFDPRKS